MKFLTSLIVLLLIAQQLFNCSAGIIKRDAHSKAEPKETTEAKNQEQESSHQHGVKHWGYRNRDKSILPKEWYKSHPKCYGTQQSPINIDTSLAKADQSLQSVQIQKIKLNETSDEEKWEMQNNGHSVVLFPKSHKIRFAAENSTYELLQMHFHWRGSEHRLNGHRFASELHLVHQNLNDPNKFAVIGFFFEQSNSDNKDLEPITDSLNEIITYDTRNQIDSLRLEKLLPMNIDKYYRYPGSLTTPGCDEVVDWFVIHEPILTISDEQVLNFQSVEDKSGYPMLTNSRPIQEINQRYVRKSFLGGFEGPSGLRSNNYRTASLENSSPSNLFKMSLGLIVTSLIVSIYQLF